MATSNKNIELKELAPHKNEDIDAKQQKKNNLSVKKKLKIFFLEKMKVLCINLPFKAVAVCTIQLFCVTEH